MEEQLMFNSAQQKQDIIDKLVAANQVFTENSGMTINARKQLLRLSVDTLVWLEQLVTEKKHGHIGILHENI
jgi:hypothetical protein